MSWWFCSLKGAEGPRHFLFWLFAGVSYCRCNGLYSTLYGLPDTKILINSRKYVLKTERIFKCLVDSNEYFYQKNGMSTNSFCTLLSFWWKIRIPWLEKEFSFVGILLEDKSRWREFDNFFNRNFSKKFLKNRDYLSELFLVFI